MEEKIDEILSE